MAPSPQTSESWRELQGNFVAAWPPDRWRDVGVVVGCSGGADSVALLRALCDATKRPTERPPRGFIVAAHFNHAIRGHESDGDQQFVEALAKQLGVRIKVGRSDGAAADESTLRSDRMTFLQRTAEQHGARYVAVAHSADDNVETVLHHLMRGSGPKGLSGIRMTRPLGQDLVLVRPLLAVRRNLIRDALQSIGQPWREDSSNTNTDYRRNWIRHELLPQIESQYPNASESITRAIEGQRSWNETIERLATDWLERRWVDRERVRLSPDNETDESILVAALQRIWSVQRWPQGAMTRTHWLRLTQTLRQATSDRYTLPGGIDVVVKNDVVEIKLSERNDLLE